MANIVQQYLREPDSLPIFTLDDQGNLSITGAITASSGGGSFPAINGSHLFFVDGGRTDSYTATGTIALPFKDIQSAINKIIANGDGVANPYVIKVAPATYSGNLTLNSLLLGDVIISNWANLHTEDASVSVNITGTITSNATNTNLTLIFEGIQFGGALTLAGNFSCLFTHCNFGGGGTISASGLGEIDFFYCHAQSVFTFDTLAGSFRGGQIGSPHTTNVNNGASFVNMHVIISGTININAGGSMTFQEGSATGGGTAVNVANTGTISVRNSIIRGTLTVAAGGIANIADSFIQAFTGTLAPESGTTVINAAILSGTAPTVAASQVGLGATHAATATAGAATLPANPLGFLIANVEGTAVKIPYYNT